MVYVVQGRGAGEARCLAKAMWVGKDPYFKK